eukprot:Transcript_18046.p1 GENE.Transcript_18046~~Transcript_18046.p1  ORF type:complete len:407 (-),score=131.54 Transcript_18046:79-1245(-)
MACAPDVGPPPRLLSELRDLLPSPPGVRDEPNASRLCGLRPPYGLVSEAVLHKERERLRAGLSAAERPAWASNGTAELCALFYERLRRVTVRRPPARYRSCAVVGSGGILSGSGSGAAIDAHEAVIRFNGAPIAGFARDVGNRTTVWVVAGQHLLGPRTVRPGELVALYCSNAWLGACHFGLLLPKRRVGSSPVLLLNPQLAYEAAALPAGCNATHVTANGRTRPSAGLMGVAMAVQLCDAVTLYGFGNDSHPNSSNACRHYYDCKFSQRRYFSGKQGYHNWHHQWRVLSWWIRAGALRYEPGRTDQAESVRDLTERPPRAALARTGAGKAAGKARALKLATKAAGAGGGGRGGLAKAAGGRGGGLAGRRGARAGAPANASALRGTGV